jgi:hypothetical protein
MERKMAKEEKKMHRMHEHRKHRMDAYGHQGGHHAGLGTTDLGIPSYDAGEPWDEPLTPLRNRFSAIHDLSQDEVLRTGAKTSAMENVAKYARPKYESEMEY